ncbi:MAG: hypothetical protein ACRDZZ_03525 [Ilumatobacteraceae bacterium]
MGEWIEIELVEEPTRQRRVAPEPAAPELHPRPPRQGWRGHRRLVAIGVAAVVVVGIGWAMARSGSDLSSVAPVPTLDPSSGSDPSDDASERFGAGSDPADHPTTTRPAVTTTTRPPLVVAQLGGQLLPSPTGIELVGLTIGGDVFDLDLDSGVMSLTDLPGGGTDGSTILAGDDWTYVQLWGTNSAYLVPRHQRPTELTLPGQLTPTFRGPEPDTFWLQQSDPSSGVIEDLSLVGLDGEPRGPTIDLQGWWPMQSDLAGGVVVQAGGGVYVVSASGARLVSDGELVGVGLNHFLLRDCDQALACGLFVVDRRTGDRRQVPVIQVDGLATYFGWSGPDSASVSPDGSAAILFGLDGFGSGAALLGTDTGVYRPLTQMTNTFSMAWSDDSRYVVFNDNRTLRAYDRDTGLITGFGDDVPQVINFAPRP